MSIVAHGLGRGGRGGGSIVTRGYSRGHATLQRITAQIAPAAGASLLFPSTAEPDTFTGVCEIVLAIKAEHAPAAVPLPGLLKNGRVPLESALEAIRREDEEVLMLMLADD